MEGYIGDLNGLLQNGSLLAIPVAFVAGILISFTPCVYPIIPIQLGFIGGQTAGVGQESEIGSKFSGRGFTLSVLFVFGMATVYAALGAFAALTGTLFGAWASSPWTYLIVANIVLIMALSMLDVFSIQAPQFLNSWSPKSEGKGYLSAVLIGASSGLVVGPCTAPALGATLAYVGAQGNVAFGVAVLFAFAFGMGILMIALGTFSGFFSALPRSGAWMEKVKKGFGITMILVAQWLIIEAGKRFI